MNKKFTLSLFVFLLIIIGLPSAFAQVSTRTSRADTALRVDVKATGTAQLPDGGGYYGMDSTTFTGTTNGFQVRGATRNVVTAAVLPTGSFFRFEDSPADTTAPVSAFKFRVNDTIFVTFSTKYSAVLPTSMQRFQFDTTANAGVAYQITGQGASTMKFHVLLTNGSTVYNTNDGTIAGTVQNSGSLNLIGVKGDTIKIVIDAAPPFSTTANTQLLLANVNVKPKSVWLQGQTQVQDTMIVAYGRYSADQVGAWQPALRNRGTVQVRRGSTYWLYDATTASLATTASTTGGAPVLLLSLLPGNANFVRWNVGFGSAAAPTIRLRADGSMLPTTRRLNFRGHLMTDETAAGMTADGTVNFRAFTVEDTVTAWVTAANAWTKKADTLFIFDKDSNLVTDAITAPVLQGVDSAGSGTPIAYLSNCNNVYGVRKYDTIYQAGRRIFNWGFDKSDDTRPDRIRKIRLRAWLPTLSAFALEDTLNSAFADVPNSFAATSAASNNTTILIKPGPVKNMAIQYNYGSGWVQFAPGAGLTITSAQAKAIPHRIRATLRDRCDNVIDSSMVSFNAFGSGVTLDTVNGATPNTYMGRFVRGLKPNNSTPLYTTDTLFLFSRTSARSPEADDKGQVEAFFNPNCTLSQITFEFKAYSDSNAATIAAPAAASVKLGGPASTTYVLYINGTNTPSKVFLTSTATGNVRHNYPTPDTSFVKVSSVDCGLNKFTLRAEAIDDCGHPIALTDTSLVTFSAPIWLKGGLYSTHSKKFGYWSDVLTINDATGTGVDSTGSYVLNNGQFKYAANGYLYLDYQVPDKSKDTVRMTANVTGGITAPDTMLVVTYSTQPSKFIIAKRAAADTMLVVSRGDVNDLTKTTWAYGRTKDCNSEPVSAIYSGNTSVIWRMLGTARASASIFDPTVVYAGVAADAPVLNGTANIGVQRGRRQYVTGALSAGGRIYVGINSDTVGGNAIAGTITGSHVFPIERDNVFPTGSYDATKDSLVATYAWSGSDVLWNAAVTYNPSTGLTTTTTLPAGSFNYTTWATTDAKRLDKRGYNQLTAEAWYVNGSTATALTTTYDPVTVPQGAVRYMVVPDSANQIAWVDGTGNYYDQPVSNTNFQSMGINFLNLYGRQAAPIVKQSVVPGLITTRLVVDQSNNVVNDGTLDANNRIKNTWWGGRNYAGRVDSLYARIYDEYGNPVDYAAAGVNVTTSRVSIYKDGTKRTNARPSALFANSYETVYNQDFIGGNTATQANVTWLVQNGTKLRGAIGVAYQTLFSALDGKNFDDTAKIAATIVSNGATLADTAVIRSKPTGDLAAYTIDSSSCNTTFTGSPVAFRWTAVDAAPTEVPTAARLLWYDYRISDTTKVIVAVNENTNAPLMTLYPTLTLNPTSTKLYGYARVKDANTVPSDITYFSNAGATYGTFVAKQTGSFVGGYYKDAASTINSGFVLGRGRFDFTNVKADTFGYTIVDSATASIVGTATCNVIVKPGPIHWVSMVNPNAARPELEATYPYPIRKNYTGLVNFPGTSTGDTFNENWVGSVNPRSYATPVDTIFIGQHYDLELRNYDRYGNRNTDDSIYVSAETSNGFWLKSLQGAGFTGEVLLDQDTTGKAIDKVMDLLQTIPTTDNNGDFAAKIRINYNPSPSSMMSAVINGPDLPKTTAIVVAFRDVYVKTLKAPGALTITNTNVGLVRLDNGNFTAMWTAAANTNLYEDSIKYTWYIKDLNDAAVTSINVGYGLTSKTLTPADMASALGLGAKNYNRTVKWYVVATNKWGLSTQSTNTVTTIFELNKAAETFALTATGLPSDTKLVNSTATPLTLGWAVPVDSNGATDLVNTTKVTSYGVDYTLDTLTYKVILTKVGDFPTGTGYAGTSWTKVATLGNALTISVDTLKALLGTADSVKYTWQVFAKDRSVADWSSASFVTASNVLPLKLTKIGTLAKIKVGASQNSTNPLYTFPVTDSVSFTLTAYDGDDNPIRGFNSFGVNLKLVPVGAKVSSVPEQKTTLVDLSAGKVLAGDITAGFTLPSTAFVSGVATISYRNTKAGDTVQIQIPDANPSYKMVVDGNEVAGMLLISGDKTRNYLTTPGTVASLKVQVKPRSGVDIVFIFRKMEVVITPIDAYKNEIVNVSQDIPVNVTARYPDEFIGGNTLFSGSRLIRGRVNYILTPNQARNDQWIKAYIANDITTQGTSNSFQIVYHDPSAFTLVSPQNNATISLTGNSQRTSFTWTQSTDPNNTPLITTVPLSDGKVKPDTINDADVINYTFKIKENNTITLPDSVNTDMLISATGTTLFNLMKTVGGSVDQKKITVNWYIVADDGIHQTLSDSRVLTIQNDGINAVEETKELPTKFAVGQNYPNPFNPTTNINYELPKASDVKIVIYNILGQPVRTLVNARQEASFYTITWDGKNDLGMPVSTGTYIYSVKAGEFTATKKMNLLK
jgi:hypothetical protein